MLYKEFIDEICICLINYKNIKMKKIYSTFLVIAAALSISSCTADYDCKCTNKSTIGSVSFENTSEYTVEGATRFQAQAACNEATVKETGNTGSSETKCELTKK
jgi:hypothetical protein